MKKVEQRPIDWEAHKKQVEKEEEDKKLAKEQAKEMMG